MPYSLRDGLSFCSAGGRFYFLDIDHDRYFCLSDHASNAFVNFLSQEVCSEQNVMSLVRSNVLVPSDARPGTSQPTPMTATKPARSAEESYRNEPDVRFSTALEVIGTIYRVSRQLKSRHIRDVLEGIIKSRNRQAPNDEPTDGPEPVMETKLLEAAMQFSRARRYAPFEPTCLLDSLALIAFLARRQLHAKLIFGIVPEPFSAHCWVQRGDLALNDSLSNLQLHTPIKIV